jgi:phosphate uptake regulator
MERRKLQQVGGGTYTVSVPKEWAEAQSLSAGSTIHLYPRGDGSLVVRTEETDGGALTETRVEMEGADPGVVRAELSGAHAAGFEAVTFEADDPFTGEQRRTIEAATRGLVGMEMTEEGETEITVRNLLDASEFSPRQSVVQLQFVALSALRRATTALSEADGDAVDRLAERAAEADRLCDVIARRFDRSLSSFAELDRLGCTRTELFDYYATADELVGVADRSVDVARMAASLSGSLPGDVAGEVRDLAETVPGVTEDAAAAALAEDRAAAHDVLDRCEEARATVERLDRRLSAGNSMADRPGDASALLRALDSLDRVLDGAGDVAAVAVRSARR